MYRIDVLSAGTVVGPGPITSATSWSNIERLDRGYDFSFDMPATDPRAALIQAKRTVKCYGLVNGAVTLLGAGIIDDIAVKIGDPVMLTVSGGGIDRELTYRSVGFLELTDGSGGGVSTALADIMALAPTGWALDAVNGYSTTAGLVYAEFAGELVLSALIKIAESTGEHFRLSADKKVVWLRSDTPSSGIRAVQAPPDPLAVEGNPDLALITSLEEVQDTYDVVSRIYVYGAGNAEARLTLAAATDSAPTGYTLSLANNYLQRDDAYTAYGLIERHIAFKEIAPISNTDPDMEAAANALLEAAHQYLVRYGEAAKFYRLNITKLDGTLLPGQTIHVTYRRVVDGYTAVDIDEDLHVLETTNQIDANGIRTTGLLVATVRRWPVSDADLGASEIEEGRVFQAHPQLNANSYISNYVQPMDDGTDAKFLFWLGAEVVTVNQVVARFQVNPLRSTVKSVGASTVTSASGGGSTVTSASGGGETLSKSDHQHFVVVFDGDGSDGDPMYFDAGSGGIFYADYGGGGSVSAPTSFSGGHEHTVSAHTHGVTVPAHTHDVTPVITTVYGLFEEAGGNTLAESNLAYSVNGSADLGAGVVDIGDGWYELDITDEVIDADTYRPLASKNALVISTATAKTAQIDLQLVVRTVIQATALL